MRVFSPREPHENRSLTLCIFNESLIQRRFSLYRSETFPITLIPVSQSNFILIVQFSFSVIAFCFGRVGACIEKRNYELNTFDELQDG
jgi:hypothetical protein